MSSQTTEPRPSPASQTSRPRRSLLAAALRLRCPRCREARLFRGMAKMNDPCPVCGLVFEREPGYFIGAMYFSYALAVLMITPLFIFFYWLLPTWPGPVIALLALLPFLPFVPAVYRYSRVIWLYFERGAAPTELSSNQGWLMMREESTHNEASPKS
ncbi:MAG TPA: DUF983 domain-containing protein [Gemmataceae bacterium]|nr:DUF983 domain-containing protein [Gemmataceae bacterium]